MTDRRSGMFKYQEALSPEERQAHLENRLCQTIVHAYGKSPAFRAKMDSIGATPDDIQTPADLTRLPITSKADLVQLQKNDPPFGGFVTVPPSKLGRVFISPGPIREPWPRQPEDDRWAQALFAAGLRAEDLCQISFGFQLTPFSFMLDDAAAKVGAVTVPTGPGNTELQIEIMRDLKVGFFCGTPSFLHTIGVKAVELGLNPKTDLDLKAVFVAAEMLPETLRDELERTFGATVRQAYGTADVGCLGFECFHKGGMHLPDDVIVEIVDPDTGAAMPPGEVGEVVATNFDPIYPLIRFGTGDLSSLDESRCRCGRTTPKLTGIKGRVDQVTKVKGMFIHPGQVDQIARKFAFIKAYRVIVDRKNQQDQMIFQVEVKGGKVYEQTLADQIKAAMVDVLRLKGEVEIVAAGTIPEGGKTIVDQRKWD